MKTMTSNSYKSRLSQAAIALVTTLGIAAAGPASAQSSSVEAQVGVMNVPGGYTSYPPRQDGRIPLSVDAAAGGTFNNGYGAVAGYGSGHAGSGTDSLYVNASAQAQRISANYFWSDPVTSTNMKFHDTLVVTSSTLKYGTPVTIVIDPGASPSLSGTSLFQGSASVVLSAAGQTSANRYELMYGSAPTSRYDGPIAIQTKVGSSVPVDVSLSARAVAFYFKPGPYYNGFATAEASCKIKVTVLTAGAVVTPASGHAY
jgi:hypothetical protein